MNNYFQGTPLRQKIKNRNKKCIKKQNLQNKN